MASRVVAMARTLEVRRTSPWGIMPITAATAARIASLTVEPLVRSVRRKSPSPRGTRPIVATWMIASSVPRISDLIGLTYFASALMRAA